MVRWLIIGAIIGALYALYMSYPVGLNEQGIWYLLGGAVGGAFIFGLMRLVYLYFAEKN